MSLARLAIRIAAVGAVRGKTWAEGRVRDSEISPFDVLAQTERQPYVAVYVDDGEFMSAGRQLLSSDGTFSLVFEAGVTAQMTNDEAWGIPTTDAGMELTLDVIERQIKTALLDPDNAWAEMWRRLVVTIEKIKTIRGSSAEKGVRYAGRQMEIILQPVGEPIYGPPPTGLWAEFIALLAADAEFAPLAPVVSALIQAPVLPFTWDQAQAQFGLTWPELDAMLASHRHNMGDTPISDIEAVAAPPA